MKPIAFLPLIALIAACDQTAAPPASQQAEAPRAPTAGAERLAPGVISTGAPEFAASLETDGSAFYFNRADETGHMAILRAERDGESWSEPVPMAFTDSRYTDVDPFLSPLGDRLYFNSVRPRPGADGEEPGDFNVWYVERDGEGWSEPVMASDALNADEDEVFISETCEGELFFVRFAQLEDGEWPILLTASRDGAGFTPAERVMTAPDGLRLTNSAVSADGRILVMVATDVNEADLYYARRGDDGAWSAFAPLSAAVNGLETAEFAPYLGPDDRLYFTSDRGEGERDIYSVPLQDALPGE